MDIRGTILVTILSLGVITGVFYGYQYYDGNTNINDLEAIAIAKSDSFVQDWIVQNRASSSASYNDGIWDVRFVAVLTQGLFLLVKIDDAKEALISTETQHLGDNQFALGLPEGDLIRSPNENQQDMVYDDRQAGLGYFEETCVGGMYADCSRYYEADPEFIEQAIGYVTGLALLSEFLSENEMEFYVYSDPWGEMSFAYVWGWNEGISDEYIYLNIILNFEEIGDKSWNFILDTIESNVLFGETQNNLDNIMLIIETSTEFLNFSSEVENYTQYTSLIYSIDNGFTFDVSFHPEYYWYDEYDERDQSDSGGTDDNPVDDSPEDPDESTSYISVEYRWIEFIIGDASSSIIEIWGTDSNQMMEDEVMQIALNDETVEDWLTNVDSYTFSAYYNDRGNWWINLVEDDDYYTYAYLGINDRTGEITEFYSAVSIPATLTETEVRGIVLSAESAAEYFDRVVESDSDLYYDQYGTWWVYFYDLDDWRNSLYVQLNDTDASIIQLRVQLTKPADMSDEEVIDVLLDAGLQEFIDTYDSVEIYNYYDGFGVHYVYAYDLILLEASAWGSVNDTSGVVIAFISYHPDKLPTMTATTVLKIAQKSFKYLEFLDIVDEIFEYTYFYGGMWYIYAFGFDENNYYSVSIAIDDETGLIIDEYSYFWNESDYRNDDDDEWSEPVEPKNP